ncbi:MAG TPA: nucleoside 2-deoxyribosyltransferase [Pyrinomonadaceae bacterium]|jgi:nucleoside 2-deoxyribosyltransferase|nr:nucleoside 2-deoxyribosyltransferase [Pyrinomonadaceae bacterium]
MGTEMKIYFAGSIRGGREDWSLYLEIIERLKCYGEILTEHIGDAELDARGESGNDVEIHDRDLRWLEEAECLVAEVTRPSLGVGYEIGKATTWGKPVLCLFRPSEGRSLSAMIAGAQGVAVREYGSAEELKPIFEEFYGGLRIIDRAQ